MDRRGWRASLWGLRESDTTEHLSTAWRTGSVWNPAPGAQDSWVQISGDFLWKSLPEWSPRGRRRREFSHTPYVHAKSLQSCLTLCSRMGCSLPGPSVHGTLQTRILGILQARILQWVATSFSRGSFQPRDWICVSPNSCTAHEFFTPEPLGKPFTHNSRWQQSNQMPRVAKGQIWTWGLQTLAHSIFLPSVRNKGRPAKELLGEERALCHCFCWWLQCELV